MTIYIRAILFTVILSLGCGIGVSGDQDLPESAFKVLPAELVERAVALRERALKESRAYDFLASLTTEIGPRFAGSANDRRAVEWALRKFKELGFSNVRAEEVAVPCWERGVAKGEITTPVRRLFKPLALGGSVETPPGGLEAELIEVFRQSRRVEIVRNHA